MLAKNQILDEEFWNFIKNKLYIDDDKDDIQKQQIDNLQNKLN